MRILASNPETMVPASNSSTPRLGHVHYLLLASLLFSHTMRVDAQTWNLGAGGSWNSAASWNPATVPNATGAAATFNNAASGSNPAQTGNRTVTADNPQTVGSIIFNNDAANAFTMSVTTGTNGALTFDESGNGPATIVVNGIAGATGNNTISVATTLSDSLVATVNNTTASSQAGALNLTATISGLGGFTKQGDGLATFGTGAKTYSGPTFLNGGPMRISLAAAPTSTSSFTINSGAQLDLISSGSFTFGIGPLNLNGAGATSGPYAVFPGTIRNDTGLSVTINNPVVLQSDTLIHVQASAGTGVNAVPTGSNTFTGPISGPGKLTITAPNSNIDIGSVILTTSNSYSGGTLVNGGLLIAGGSAANFGGGDVTVDHTLSPSSIARLVIQSGVQNAVADTATLSLAGGGMAGVADQGFVDLGSGVNEVVGALKLAGAIQPPGTYGSTASSATFKSDEFFAGTGIITALGPPSLKIILSPPNVILSWPTNAEGYGLQAVGSLSAAWADDNTMKTISGTNYTVSESVGTNRFYRLKK